MVHMANKTQSVSMTLPVPQLSFLAKGFPAPKTPRALSVPSKSRQGLRCCCSHEINRFPYLSKRCLLCSSIAHEIAGKTPLICRRRRRKDSRPLSRDSPFRGAWVRTGRCSSRSSSPWPEWLAVQLPASPQPQVAPSAAAAPSISPSLLPAGHKWVSLHAMITTM